MGRSAQWMDITLREGLAREFSRGLVYQALQGSGDRQLSPKGPC